MHCHRILVSALSIDMSSILTSFISNKYFYFHLFPLVFVHCQIYIFFNVALVVVIVVQAAVGSVELQRERERLTVSSVELQRGSLPMQREVTVN